MVSWLAPWRFTSWIFQYQVISASVFGFQCHQHNLCQRVGVLHLQFEIFLSAGFPAAPPLFFTSLTAHQMNQALEIVLGCFLGKGVGVPVGFLSLQFKILKGITFWMGLGERESSLSQPFQFKSPLSFLPSLFCFLTIMKSFPNLTVHWITCWVFQKWGFLRLCFRFTGPDSEGLETRLIARVPSLETQRSERTTDTSIYTLI